MTDNGIGDFFITDADEVAEIGGVKVPPVIIPSASGVAYSPPAQEVVSAVEPEAPEPADEALPPTVDPAAEAVWAPATMTEPPAAPPAPGGSESVESSTAEAQPAISSEWEPEVVPVAAPARPAEAVDVPASEVPQQVPGSDVPTEHTAPPHKTREQQLIAALDTLMEASEDIEAAALVSLDGFIMAAALPEGMLEDKVGAMSAAILGLGERAAIELGRGNLTQVFIEGEGGYVLLIAVGDRAVLTVLAGEHAKLGLVLYDMRAAAEAIARLLG